MLRIKRKIYSKKRDWDFNINLKFGAFLECRDKL